MGKKIKQNYILLEDIQSTRVYKHISPVAFTIIALTFFVSIPSSIFWTLIVIYILYCFVPLNPDVDNLLQDSEFHPSFSVENSNAPSGLAALLGDSDGLRKLQTFAKFFLPREKTKAERPEIQTATRRTSLRQSMSIEGQTLLHRFSSTKQRWLSFISGHRPSTDSEDSPYYRSLSSQHSISSSHPDLNANYLSYEDDFAENSAEVLAGLEDADVIVMHDNESNSEDSLVLLEEQQAGSAVALQRSVSTKLKKDTGKKSPPPQQQYKNIVNVVLIRGKHLDIGCDYYLKFKLGLARCKSKHVTSLVTFPYWGEEFNFHLYPAPESQLLEIFLCVSGQSSEQYLEKTIINLDHLTVDVVYRRDEKFTSDFADKRSVELQITVTGGYPKRVSEPLGMCVNGFGENCSLASLDSGFWDLLNSGVKIESNGFAKGLVNFYDVGTLKVKVIEADLGNVRSHKMNPFCIVELMNDKFRTHTEYRTATPKWAKTFEFNPKDILHYLVLSVYNEESKQKSKFIGKAVVPLLEIENGGKHWYQLKDQKFRSKIPGKLLLEFGIDYNWIKCGARAIFTKKETHIIPQSAKFQKAHFMRNAFRLKALINLIVDWWSFWNTIISWQHPIRSIVGVVYSVAFVWYFEWFHCTLAWLLYILQNFAVIQMKKYKQEFSKQIATIAEQEHENNVDSSSSSESVNSLSDLTESHLRRSSSSEQINQVLQHEEELKEETLKEKLQSMQEVGGFFLKLILRHSSLIDKFVTISNFSVPFQSWVMVAILILIVSVGFRMFFMILLVNEFMKHLRGHNYVGNNEVLNVLLRAPGIEELILYQGCKIDDN